jgi:hypothetical protein
MPQGLVLSTRGQGVCREAESEGLEEKYQAVTNGATRNVNRSAKDGIRSSLHYGDEGVLAHPSHQGVCGRHGTEDDDVTRGDLVMSETKALEDEWVNKVKVVALYPPPLYRTYSSYSNGYYKETPKWIQKHCEKSESRIVL